MDAIRIPEKHFGHKHTSGAGLGKFAIFDASLQRLGRFLPRKANATRWRTHPATEFNPRPRVAKRASDISKLLRLDVLADAGSSLGVQTLFHKRIEQWRERLPAWRYKIMAF